MFESLMNVAESGNPSYGDMKYYSGVQAEEIEKAEVLETPQQFFSDVMALTQQFGILHEGMKIELSLQEALEILPRKRERSDAYLQLQKYLSSERGILLTIKSKKNNGKKEEN